MAIKRIYIRRDTTANWALNNPILHIGEIGYDIDLLDFKFGDSVTDWANLPFYSDTISVGIKDHTYSELEALKTSSLLEIGQVYRITNFQTIYNQPITGTLLSGSVEPIILTALTANSFDKIVKSSTNPADIIYYDFNDNVTEVTSTSRPGKIIYRINEYNNIAYFDHREVLSYYSGSNYSTFGSGSENNFIGRITETDSGFSDYNNIVLGTNCNNINFGNNCYNVFLISGSNDINFGNNISNVSGSIPWNLLDTKSNVDFTGIDFSSATYISSSLYNKEIFLNANQDIKLSFVDEYNSTVIVDVND